MKKLATKKIGLTILIFLMITSIGYFNYLRPSRHEYTFYAMDGIPLKIIVYYRSYLKFREDIKATKTLTDDLEKVFNAYLESSELTYVNNHAYEKEISVDPQLQNIIKKSRYWWEKTNGAFDISVKPLIDLWKESAKNNTLPDSATLKQTLNLVGMNKIILKDNKLKFTKSGVKLDLGGIAKGYIVDQIAELLQNKGAQKGLIDAGGDILAFGNTLFRVGVQDPTKKVGDEIIGIIELEDKAVVSSGNYERFVEIQEKRFSHIINPKDGRPSDNNLIAVTVLAETCTDADALATALMVMGAKDAKDFLKKNSDFMGILIEKDNGYSVWVSENLISKTSFEKRWENKVKVID